MLFGVQFKFDEEKIMPHFKLFLFCLLIIPISISAQQPQLHIIGEPELSPTDIVAVRDDNTGKFCAAIQVITDLQGFGYSSDIGVVRVDFSKPGRDMVFLLPDERVLEIYHPDHQPLKLIFSEMSINLQPKRVWIIKLTGDKKMAGGIPVLIETNTDSVEIAIDGESKGIKQSVMVTDGKHEIKLSKPDYETIIDTILVDENNKQFSYALIIKQVMVFVKGSTFKMGDTFGDGDDDEQPVHEVRLNDFYIGKYEVTNAQYCKFLNEKGNQEEGGKKWLDIESKYCLIEKRDQQYAVKAGYENHPVIKVTWYGARAYCEWAGGRLPTEAEWEYACRGGSRSAGYKYSGSNNVDEVAWYSSNSGNRTHKVGTKQPNELELYDMSGNVREWCADWYDNDYYSKSKKQNPEGPASGSSRVFRGGSWGVGANDCRVANRGRDNPDFSSFSNGFRVVQDSPQ